MEEIEGSSIATHPVKGRFVIGWKRSVFGSDVIDENGTPLRPKRNGIIVAASIVKEHFPTTEPGQPLMDSWHEVMISKVVTLQLHQQAQT